jgi:hypothetical protein
MPQPPPVQPTRLPVLNALHPGGELVVDVFSRPQQLLVPTAKSLTEPLGPPRPSSVDHYQCAEVKVNLKVGAPFPNDLQVAVSDQFEQPTVYELEKPIRLCVAADKNGEGITQPEAHLLCYLVKPVERLCTAAAPVNSGQECQKEHDCGGEAGATHLCAPQPAQSPVGGIFVHNQFGLDQLDALQPQELCLPTELLGGL